MAKTFNIAANGVDCQTLHTAEARIEITVGDGGQLALTLCAPTSGEQTITARIGRNAQLYLTTVDIDSGGLVRHTTVELAEQGAECHLSGLFISRGNERVENHTSIRHTAPNCHSEQLYHGIATDRSTAFFNGLIYVAPDAQQTVALQENHNICLTNTAKVYTQPQLEIYADDVKCNHGATVGRRNEQAMFYMRQRGLSESAAQALLIESFALAPLNEQIEPAVREKITQTIHSL